MMWRWVMRLAAAGVLVLVITVALVLWRSERNFTVYGDGRALDRPVDAVIVLGGGIDGDGVPGYSNRRRVALAVTLLRDGRANALILTGGVDPRWPETPAAQLMADYARSLGAPADALIIEDRSRSTFQNLRFALELAQTRGFERLALVTDAFHVERARWLAVWLGAPEIVPVAVAGLARTGPETRVWSIVREALAWWFNLGKVAAWEAMELLDVDQQTRAALVQ